MKPRILVPYDFGPSSARALEWAADLQGTVGGQPIQVIHVVNPVPPAQPAEAMLSLSPRDLDELAEELKRAVRTIHVAATTSLVLSPQAGHAIVEAAAASSVDLIVMGTHGRGGLSRLLLGSAAEYVVRHAACPVVTMRAPAAAASRAA